MKVTSYIFGLGAIALAAAPVLATSTAIAQATPRAQGQNTQRATVLNALRPRAVRDLGAPVEFVVSQYRQVGNLAFVSVTAQRPGGRAIDLSRTPVGKDGAAEEMDGATIQAFFKRTNGTWRVDLYAIGATDLWYMDPLICATYVTVMTPQLCPATTKAKL